MNEREMLELAAKAAGYLVGYVDGVAENRVHPDWNPVTDDGDALRLAVKLGLVVDAGGVTPNKDRIHVGGLEGYLADEPKGADPYAATRRAITRAAAEIGKGMP